MHTHTQAHTHTRTHTHTYIYIYIPAVNTNNAASQNVEVTSLILLDCAGTDRHESWYVCHATRGRQNVNFADLNPVNSCVFHLP
jgi:hypothetical protein